jgi:hypothetical protein
MERAKDYCGRKPNHKGDHRTRKSMEDNRLRLTDRRRGTRLRDDPAARARWNRKYRLSQYGITQKQFDWLLEVQNYDCAMGGEPFTEDSPIYVGHDHGCCPDEKKSCGKCIRGLLCRNCNTALGHIERKLRQAQAYVASPPGKLLPAA